jgi:glutathione S-transferase
MIGDVASSIFGGNNIVSQNSRVESALASISTDSWNDIRTKLESQQTAEERSFRKNLEKGYGVGSPLHKIRLFDESNKEEDIDVVFYRDSASWCVSYYYCSNYFVIVVEFFSPILRNKI